MPRHKTWPWTHLRDCLALYLPNLLLSLKLSTGNRQFKSMNISLKKKKERKHSPGIKAVYSFEVVAIIFHDKRRNKMKTSFHPSLRNVKARLWFFFRIGTQTNNQTNNRTRNKRELKESTDRTKFHLYFSLMPRHDGPWKSVKRRWKGNAARL